MSTFLSMTLTANGRALRVLFVDAAARRTVLAKLLYDGFLSVRKFPSDCRCALAQKQPGPIRKNGHKNTTVRRHRGSALNPRVFFFQHFVNLADFRWCIFTKYIISAFVKCVPPCNGLTEFAVFIRHPNHHKNISPTSFSRIEAFTVPYPFEAMHLQSVHLRRILSLNRLQHFHQRPYQHIVGRMPTDYERIPEGLLLFPA